MPQQPKPIAIFGILNISFGVLGLISAAAWHVAILRLDQTLPVWQMIHSHPIYLSCLKIFTPLGAPLGIIASIALLVTGVGLLALKNWARLASILYGFYAIISGCLGVVLNFIFVFQPILAHRGSMEILGVAIGLGGQLLVFAYAIFLVSFLRHSEIVAAFCAARVDPSAATSRTI